MSDLTFLPAVEMAKRVRERKISSVELVEAHLKKIERVNSRLNAFIHVDADGARQQAHEAEKAATNGKPLGPLHGVPVSVKSSIEVAGLRCEAGTRLRAGFTARRD